MSMHITQLNRECLLHLFSFLDKDSRQSLSFTCLQLREVFLDPSLWTLLLFCSPAELKRDNYMVSSSLRCLSVCWHSSRVKVCNIEDWLKTAFQKNVCSQHAGLVTALLSRVCHTCPNLISLTLVGCGHITDDDVVSILKSCKSLRNLHLENCVRITDSLLRAIVIFGSGLKTVRVDFCRNVTQAGLQVVASQRPQIHLSADRSAGMIPDCAPKDRQQGRQVHQSHVWDSIREISRTGR